MMAPSGTFWMAIPRDSGHPFREIVDGNGQGQHGGLGKLALGAFGAAHRMQVGCNLVYQQKERKTSQKAQGGGPDTAHLQAGNE